MKSRLIASAALGAAVLLGTTGCAMISTQATTLPYSPGEGVNIPDSGPVLVRNALIVSEQQGGEGNMIAALINPTGDDETITIQLGEGSSSQSTVVTVEANSTLSLGNPSSNTAPLLIDEVDGPPGSTVTVYFQSGDAEGIEYQVPVLDGELDYYGELLP